MALQRTAHSACSRKVHCVTKKYLDDPFVSFFAKDDTIVNSPLMNRGTWLRTTAIERCVRSFYERAGCPVQIISFGAGVDTLYFRLKREGHVQLTKYVELDFSDLVEEKHAIIKGNPPLSSLVGPEYSLLACDLRRPETVTSLLGAHIERGVPTLLLAEMVFVYIEGSITTELLKRTLNDVIGTGSSVELVTYDAMLPHDRFGQMMVENLSASGVFLKGINELPTTSDHEKRCKEVGFKYAKCVSMKALYLTVPRETVTWLNRLEMIDDWDEWNLVHEHYCFSVSSTLATPPPPVF